MSCKKINGWKIYHLSSTMEDIVDVESELTQRLSGLQKRLEKVAHPDLSHRGDLAKVHELIKANLQRSKVIQDQVNESKTGQNGANCGAQIKSVQSVQKTFLEEKWAIGLT